MTQSPDGTRLRVAFLGIVFAALVGALVLRLYFLQVLSHQDYAFAAENNRVRIVPVEPSRGRILDRNGEELVRNRESYVVGILLDRVVDRSKLIQRLAPVLGMTPDQIGQRLADKTALPYTAVPIKEDVSEETAVYLLEHSAEFPGVVADEQPMREYPKGRLAAHLLGYVGEITADQLEQDRFKSGYRLGSLVGKGGLEEAYEGDLRGKEGHVKLLVDASGKVRGNPLGAEEMTPGSDVYSTLDTRVQTLVEQSLEQGIVKARTIFDKESQRNYVAPAGGAVVMDPRNGEIIAVASFPTFDPSSFIGGISRTDFEALSNDPAHPLVNRVTQAPFPPGSTFKVITAAAALQEGIASRNGRFNCPGSFRFADTTFRNWKTTDSGIISLPQALIDSCDTVFYDFGAKFYGRFLDAKRQGGSVEKLQDYARDFGFGEKTDLEISSEKAGRVPDEGWLKEANRRYPNLFPYATWLPGYTINMSIGQGDVLTTPLQITNAYAAIANGGTLYKPHIGLRVEGSTGRQIAAEEKRRITVSAANLDVIRRGLERVATDGTARGAFLNFPFGSISVAAKTGTAELKTVPPKQPYAWFVAYAPARDPRYVVTVMLEEGGHGGETAAPIARRILEGLFGLPLSDITPAARTD